MRLWFICNRRNDFLDGGILFILQKIIMKHQTLRKPEIVVISDTMAWPVLSNGQLQKTPA